MHKILLRKLGRKLDMLKHGTPTQRKKYRNYEKVLERIA